MTMRLNSRSWVRERKKVVAKRLLEVERAKKKDKEAKRIAEKTKRFAAKAGKKAEGSA
jgi:hypothetical protein